MRRGRAWRGSQALAGPAAQEGGAGDPGAAAPARYTLPARELPSGDVLAYLTSCECGQKALTRTLHSTQWVCPQCEERGGTWAYQPTGTIFGEPEPGWAGRDNRLYREVDVAAAEEVATPPDPEARHCARCGDRVDENGHPFCWAEFADERSWRAIQGAWDAAVKFAQEHRKPVILTIGDREYRINPREIS